MYFYRSLSDWYIGLNTNTKTEIGIAEQLIKKKHLAIVDKWNIYLFWGRLLNVKKLLNHENA